MGICNGVLTGDVGIPLAMVVVRHHVDIRHAASDLVDLESLEEPISRWSGTRDDLSWERGS